MVVLYIFAGSTSECDRATFGITIGLNLQRVVFGGMVCGLLEYIKGYRVLQLSLGFYPDVGCFVLEELIFGTCRGYYRIAIQCQGA